MACGFVPSFRSHWILQCVASCIAFSVPNAQASLPIASTTTVEASATRAFRTTTSQASPSVTISEARIKKLDCVMMLEACGDFVPGGNVIAVEGETPGFRENGRFTLVNITGVRPWGMGCYIQVFWHSVTHGANKLPPEPQKKFEQCLKTTFTKVNKSECPDNSVGSEGHLLCVAAWVFFENFLLLGVINWVLALCGRSVENGMLWIALGCYWSAAVCMSVFATIKVWETYPTAHFIVKLSYAFLVNWIFLEGPMQIIAKCLSKLCCKETCGYLIFIMICCLIGGKLSTIVVRDSYTPSSIVLMGRHPVLTGLFMKFMSFLIKDTFIAMFRDSVCGMLSLCGMPDPFKSCGCEILPELNIDTPSECKGWVCKCIGFIVAGPGAGTTPGDSDADASDSDASDSNWHQIRTCCAVPSGCLCRRIRFQLVAPLPKFKKTDNRAVTRTESSYVSVSAQT